MKIGLRQRKTFELKSGTDRAANKSPRAGCLCALPIIFRNNRLWGGTQVNLRAKALCVNGSVLGFGDVQVQGRTGVEVPDFDRIDLVPVATLMGLQ